MKRRDKAYRWWKRRSAQVRKPIVFAVGLIFICAAPLIGWLPGPGGIILFLGGIGILASEFDWAESLKAFFLHTVPKEIKNRWQPTPKWQLVFDLTAVLLISTAAAMAYFEHWVPVLSFGFGGLCLFLFNRDRLSRLKKYLNRRSS